MPDLASLRVLTISFGPCVLGLGYLTEKRTRCAASYLMR